MTNANPAAIISYEDGSRPTPVLPNQVYAWNPTINDTRVVADGFGRPNGITVNVDGSIFYIGDTGADIGNGTLDTQGPRTIYAFDRSGGFLVNRRVFAMPNGLLTAPDGIKVDTDGNVWAVATGKTNGEVVVWNAAGTLLGKIKIPTVPNNFGFGEPGEVIVLGQKVLYKLCLSENVIGVRP